MPNNAYGFTYPSADDQADGPAAFLALANSIGPYSNMRFASAAARDALLTAPVEGMICWLQDLNIWTFYDGTVWLPFGGAIQTYVPTWGTSGTAPTLGTSTLTGRWLQFGKIVAVLIEFVAAAGVNFGTGTWTFTLPVAQRSTARVGIRGLATDSSAGTRYPAELFWSGAGSPTAVTYVVSGSDIIQGGVTNTAPFAWTTTDTLVFMGTYEAA